MSPDEQWRRCSACKKPIAYGATYWVCSVSTCNRKRTALAFCSDSCWEVHLPVARHREAWAVEETAPTRAAAAAQASAAAPRTSTPRPAGGGSDPTRRTGVRRIVRDPAPAGAAADDLPKEVLIIGSRLKDYVRARCGFNTSDRVLEPLSDIVRRTLETAIRNAERDGRKTILDRDVPKTKP